VGKTRLASAHSKLTGGMFPLLSASGLNTSEHAYGSPRRIRVLEITFDFVAMN